MSAPLTHFFKHRSYTLLRRRSRLLHPPYSPLTLFLTTSYKAKDPSPWTPSSNTAKLSSSSSSSSSCIPTKAEESFTYPSYLSVHICCRKDVADMLSEALLCFGASSTTMDEEDTFKNSDEIFIDSIFPEGEDVNVCISHAANSIGLKEIPHYEVKMGEQYDWIKKTQESFHPVEVIEGIWVVPQWRSPPDDQATNIILNPGLAFGTGEHPTTKMCLLLLHRLIKGGELVFDYGTGSGVLAIAALKLSYIIEQYSPFLEGISVSEIDGWACVSGIKKRNLADSRGNFQLAEA